MTANLAEIARWDGFYAILGSAAGALIGLQFVVMTLIAERPPRDAAAAGAAFATPTIIHFATVLVLAAIFHVPWPSVAIAAAAWGAIGVAGFVYCLIVVRRMRTQKAYRPVFEDWFFYSALPLLAYAVLAASSLAARLRTAESLLAVGAATLLLLLMGIHNAWDSVTHHVIVSRHPPPSQ